MDEQTVKQTLLLLGINYKEKGDRLYSRCPNPYHQDIHPSWSIDKHKGIYNCYSCGFKGNIFTLVKELTGQSFYEFMKIQDISSFVFSSTLSNSSYTPPNFGETRFNEVAIEGALHDVHESDIVMNYLKSRGVNDTFINDLGIKYCTLAKFNKKTYIERVCIPIYENHKLISMEGRDYTRSQKVKVLYPKGGSVNTLFNIDNLDRKKLLIIVEGIFDTVKIYQHITKNVTCTFGSNITPRQRQLINEFDEVAVMSDNDAAGDKMRKSFEDFMRKEYYIIRYDLRFKDPGDAPIEVINRAIKNKKLAVKHYLEASGLIDEVFRTTFTDGWVS